MGGYWGRQSGASEVADPLGVRALALEADGTNVLVLSLDLVALAAPVVAAIRGRIAVETAVEAGAVMVCCTHTHSGPLTFPFRGMGEIDEEYLATVVDTCVATASEAVARLAPAEFGYARVGVQIGFNRRETQNGTVVIGHNPDGTVYPHAHVLHIDGDGRTCVLFNHPCHPTVLGPTSTAVSADFVGAAITHVEERTGGAAIFLNGACGDINPRKKGDTGSVLALGRELGAAVVDGMAAVAPLERDGLQLASAVLHLPLIEPPARSRLALEKLTLKLRMGLIKLASRDIWAQLPMKAQLQWAEELLEVIKRDSDPQHQRFELQALRIGAFALLGMEGEMFVRYQRDLEAETSRPIAVCGYANGCIGYVPTADEYERGGYEVGSCSYNFRVNAGVEAYRVYPSVQMIAPESETLIMEASRNLLHRLGMLAQPGQ